MGARMADVVQCRILMTGQFHPNDFEVSTSLLHEMAHVARCVQAENGSHNARWEAEIERLWQAGAPMHRDGWVFWPEVCAVVDQSEAEEWEDDDPRWYECQPDETDETGYWDGMRVSQLAEMKAGERLKILIIPEEGKTYDFASVIAAQVSPQHSALNSTGEQGTFLAA